MALLTRWTWVWVNAKSRWWTGRPGVLLFMGLQTVGHDWVTELDWTESLKMQFWHKIPYLFTEKCLWSNCWTTKRKNNLFGCQYFYNCNYISHSSTRVKILWFENSLKSGKAWTIKTNSKTDQLWSLLPLINKMEFTITLTILKMYLHTWTQAFTLWTFSEKF